MGKKIKKISAKLKAIRLEESQIKKKLLLLSGIFLASFVISFQAAALQVEKIADKTGHMGKEKNSRLSNEIKQLVAGYPIEKMVPYITDKDDKVAAYLISIAKKESNWGKRVPVLDGKDCYNYWGFRMESVRMGSGGHTCFDNPRQAVSIVGRRIAQLVDEEKIDTPREMVIWKCGYRCDGPENAGAEKWIRDVSLYYDAVLN